MVIKYFLLDQKITAVWCIIQIAEPQ